MKKLLIFSIVFCLIFGFVLTGSTAADKLLMETGSALLLETGDNILLESGVGLRKGGPRIIGGGII